MLAARFEPSIDLKQAQQRRACVAPVNTRLVPAASRRAELISVNCRDSETHTLSKSKATRSEHAMNDDDTTGAPTAPHRILIATDQSAASKQALDFARHIAPPGANVRIVSVAENPRTLFPTGALSTSVLDAARDELRQDAADAVNQARERLAQEDFQLDTDVIELAKRGGDVIHALLECASTWQAEMLIVGSHARHGWLSRWVNGTVSEPLVKLSHCPILIVPARDETHVHRAPKRVLFALDGSDLALQALRFGLALVKPDAELRAVYVVDRAAQLADTMPTDALEDLFIKQGEQALAAAKPEFERAGAGHATSAIVSTAWTRDDVAQAILREAQKWEADLIVMGTHGRRGIARWLLGSVAGRVAHAAETPLLLVGSPQ
jgi:nucleotide-binding universal stress UspA family protein